MKGSVVVEYEKDERGERVGSEREREIGGEIEGEKHKEM